MSHKQLILFLILSSTLCFAQENACDFMAAKEILTKAFSCIKYSEGDKHYLNEDNLALTSAGIFIVTEQYDPVRVPQLFSDDNGCYIELDNYLAENLIFSGNYKILNECPGCGHSYWINCKNPDCPYVKAREGKKQQKQDDRRNKKSKE